jgi:hypothetical protein
MSYFKDAIRECKDVNWSNFPLLFANVHNPEEKGNKKSGLNKCTRMYFRKLMVFIVRLHYAHYLSCELYCDKSKFDFETFPQLPKVFGEFEFDLKKVQKNEVLESPASSAPTSASKSVDDTTSRVAFVSSPPAPLSPLRPFDHTSSRVPETKVTATRLTAVVNNLCTALQEFEVVATEIIKRQGSDPNDA